MFREYAAIAKYDIIRTIEHEMSSDIKSAFKVTGQDIAAVSRSILWPADLCWHIFLLSMSCVIFVQYQSPSLTPALQAVAYSVVDRPAFFAERLYKSMHVRPSLLDILETLACVVSSMLQSENVTLGRVPVPMTRL